jgi:ABC-type nitrate/sulfonate/bicarbonate transport system substrate-binding protein
VRRLATACALVAALAVAGCGEKKDVLRPSADQHLELMLDYFPNADHAPIYSAQAHGDFKAAAAESVVELLAPVRERYAELRPDTAALEQTLAAGAEKARAIAAQTLTEVRERMGVGSPPN